MPLAATNRSKLSIVRESTAGTTPASPTLRQLRFTSESLKAGVRTKKSDEVNSDRQVSDASLLGKDVSGDINIEMSPDTYDLLLEGAMFSNWVKTPDIENSAADTEITDAGTLANTYAVASGGAAFLAGHLVKASGFAETANNQTFRVTSSSGTTVVGTGLSLTAETAPPKGARLKVIGLRGAAAGSIAAVTSGGNKLTIATTNPTTLGLVAGCWFKAKGFTGVTANNGWYRVKEITGSGPWNIIVDRVPTGFAADAAAGQTIDLLFADYVRNGTVKHSHTIERALTDLPLYFYFKGLVVDALRLSVRAQQPITGTIALKGMESPAPSGTRVSGATDVAATTTDTLDASADMGTIYENGAPLSGLNIPLEVMLDIGNNLRALPQLSSLAAAAVNEGEFSVGGTLSLYLNDETRLAKVMNNTESNLTLFLIDAVTGDCYLIDTPRLKYTEGDVGTSGANQDHVQPLKFQGLKDRVLGYTCHIQKVFAAA
jgi:hypothetical protein